MRLSILDNSFRWIRKGKKKLSRLLHKILYTDEKKKDERKQEDLLCVDLEKRAALEKVVRKQEYTRCSLPAVGTFFSPAAIEYAQATLGRCFL